ncbi:SusC/RagA family TonB-linked outer membrane protein [Robiginitalea sediminis]|uniref:SusC/RagA family TonB-linked outer membrane protein n=1 Tax=Robiginitalea sediminis TaxID=1982593 RepID=UPI000B4C0400|nr:TonB-dependent receptor [Robiginitalea sediminis]
MKHRLVLIFGFLTLGLYAQDIQVQGVILDAMTSEPLPGVNVIVKGTNRGTSADFDGAFQLSDLSVGEVLEFSYIGYLRKEYTVRGPESITITLQEDVSALDEVVVIGYGTQTKKEITGAVSVVGAETIEELNPTRIEQALQGQVAGVQITSESGSPGSGSNIRIRGISTNGDNRPLILVDGNVIEDLSVINPGDIESINILKDATAGIYGVRAANGVILITTKTGRRNTDLKFSYDAWGGMQQTSRRIPVLNATEYAVIANEAFAAGGSPNPYPTLSGLGSGTDWQDEVFRNAPIFNHNFSANGGSEKSTYSFGASYLTQDGIVGGPKANFNRSTLRFNYNTELLENLNLVANVLYTRTNRRTLPENSLGSVLFNALNNAPTFAVRDATGNFTLAEGLGNEVINPLAQIENTFNKTTVDRISGKIGAAYTLFEGLTAESNFQFNYAEVNSIFFAPTAFYGSGKVFNVERNFVVESKNIFRDYTWDTFLKYAKELGGDHSLNATLGMSVFRTSGQFSGSTGFDIPGNDFTNASIENASDVIDNFINTAGKFDSRLLSYFVRLQYDYAGKYLLSGVLRRDGSTVFGPRNKFGYFPSASLGWIVTEENFLNDSSWLDFLKLRASYGIVGNDRIGVSDAFRSILSGEGAYVFNDELRFGQAIGAISNPEIQWEEQKTLDIGLDARLFDDHITITTDYFQKRTEGLLVSPPVSGILGAAAPGSGPPFVNAGTVENKGLELAVGYQTDPMSDFSANINYNVTFLQNEVISVNNGVGFIPGGSFGVGQDPPSRMEDGFPLGYFYGLQTDGIFQTQQEVDAHATQANAAPGDLRFVDINGDGVIDTDDRTNIGDPFPDATMGLNISLGYKHWDFTAYAFASIGNEIVRNYERNQPLVNRSVYTLDRWTGPGTSTEVPRVTTGATSNTLFSDFFVEDGSFVRLQNAQLGYTFSDVFNQDLGIDKLRFYVSVNNLFTLTKYRGYDPVASSGAPIGAGIDQGFYPVARTYLLGVNFKF